MLKSTHAFIAKQIANSCNLSKSERRNLIWGSVVPDCKLSCFTKPHSLENWYYEAHAMYIKMDRNKKTTDFYYNLGILLHLFCDFFTRPHSDISIRYFKSGHAKWERDLDKLVKASFDGIIEKSEYIVDKLVQAYKKESHSLETDYKYINLVCQTLCYKLGVVS